MRILWFTNTPSLASEFLGDNRNLGGWISSLEKQISKRSDIELGIAFQHGFDPPNSFSIATTQYFSFPYPREKGKIQGLAARWNHEIEGDSNVNYYLSIINQFKPDLIHIFGSEKSYGLIIDKCKLPVVLQIQGNLTVLEKKWFSGVTLLDILRYSNFKDFVFGYNVFHQFYSFKKRASIERDFLSKCRFIIGRTSWDRRITRVLSPESKYYHCDELLRDEFYSSKWSNHEGSKITLFSIISPVVYKGLEVVLETASILTRLCKIDFEWHIAGMDGKEDIVKIIEKSTKLNFAENRILFKGSLNVKQLISILIQSSCYIHPSHIENSPNSVCEAMILGVPVIATYAGGTPSIIQNETEGLLIQDGDPYSLAGAIKELLSSPENMILFSENARRKALSRHNTNTVSDRIISIYSDILRS
jgi:glycosyltransferase involved in cell wall biosynthesis